MAAVEVVTCENCQYGMGAVHNVRCKKFYGMGGYGEYCSYGKKKDKTDNVI